MTVLPPNSFLRPPCLWDVDDTSCQVVHGWLVFFCLLVHKFDYSFTTYPLDEPQPSQPQRLSFLRGVFLANHLASNDNLTRTTRRQNTYHYHYSFITRPLDEPQPSQPVFLDCKLLTFLQPVWSWTPSLYTTSLHIRTIDRRRSQRLRGSESSVVTIPVRS